MGHIDRITATLGQPHIGITGFQREPCTNSLNKVPRIGIGIYLRLGCTVFMYHSTS
jgi:hypothetical protein